MENTNNQSEQKEENQKSKRVKKRWFIVPAIVLLYLLSFHNVICNDEWKIFPKDNLTFTNTWVNSEDITDLIEAYNRASLFEQMQMSNTTLFRKLRERGCIETKRPVNDKEDTYENTEDSAGNTYWKNKQR